MYADQANLPDKLTLEYQLNYGEILAGYSHRTLTRQSDGRYVHRTVSRPAGAVKLFTHAEWVEEGVFRLQGNRVQPITYVKFREGGSKPRRHSVTFDWGNKLARYDDGRQEPLPASAQDESSVLFDFMLNPPSSEKARHSVSLSNGKKFTAYRYQTLGIDSIDTALGRLKTLKIHRVVEPSADCGKSPGGTANCQDDNQLTLWLAVERRNLPVKIEIRDGGQKATLTLLSVNGL